MLVDLAALTTFHTALSFLALFTGFLTVAALLGASHIPAYLPPVFLISAVATSATGFAFPFNGVLPSHVVGGIALVVLALGTFARYFGRLSRSWKWIYELSMVASLYFLAFVGVAQAFLKIPQLRNAAPTQSEPPFAIAQFVLLAVFITLGVVLYRRSRRDAAAFFA
jgi:hypothetical protein